MKENKSMTVMVSNHYDDDNCIDFEIIPNKLNWMKEKDGDNLLIQYIKGGEGYRLVERYSDDIEFKDAHYNEKSIVLRDVNGEQYYYAKDKHGNYKNAKDLIDLSKSNLPMHYAGYSR